MAPRMARSMTRGDRVAGRSGSMAVNIRWQVIAPGPMVASALKGAKSVACQHSSQSAVTTGSEWWLSTWARPCPGHMLDDRHDAAGQHSPRQAASAQWRRPPPDRPSIGPVADDDLAFRRKSEIQGPARRSWSIAQRRLPWRRSRRPCSSGGPDGVVHRAVGQQPAPIRAGGGMVRPMGRLQPADPAAFLVDEDRARRHARRQSRRFGGQRPNLVWGLSQLRWKRIEAELGRTSRKNARSRSLRRGALAAEDRCEGSVHGHPRFSVTFADGRPGSRRRAT